MEPGLQLEPHGALVEQPADLDVAGAPVVHRLLDSERVTGKCDAIPVQAGRACPVPESGQRKTLAALRQFMRVRANKQSGAWRASLITLLGFLCRGIGR